VTDWESFYRSFREPDFLPGFEVLNRLGGGAFGEVYKARRVSIDKPYAIKFLKLDEEVAREVAERELEHVRLFAQIDHPNLVSIEDMGIAMGVPYLVMGYAGEDTLAKRIGAGELTREQALKYFVQVCRGVLALHDRRLAHFDLKPSNVFLRGEVARVGDYGLAKLIADGRQTLSFGRGTPRYMAPEMMLGRADHRADVYSLGVILYECLTGRPPFEGESGPGARGEPPPLPDDLPADLATACAQALSADPDDRQVSVHQLLEQLGQTARQGDSIHLRWPRMGAPPAPVPAAPASADRAARPAPEPTPAEVLEWESLGGGGGPAAPPGEEAIALTPAPPPAGPAPAGDSEDPARRAAAHVRSRTSTMLSALEQERDFRPEPPRRPGGTVPVPPAVEGGCLGAAGASAVLAVEVFATLVLAPARWLFRSTGRGLADIAAGEGRGATALRALLAVLLVTLVSAMVGAALLIVASL
jgi:serine/threonine-protein kinase